MDTRAPLPLGRCPPLETGRLHLRGPRQADEQVIAAIADDREIARRMTRLPHPYGLEDARFFLREIVPAELAWGITVIGDDELVGVAGLVPDAPHDTAELGYWLGRAHWGKGIATEAAGAIVRFAFEELGLRALSSGCFADNLSSGRVLAKLGFVETGRGTRSCLAEGRDLPFIEMLLARRP